MTVNNSNFNPSDSKKAAAEIKRLKEELKDKEWIITKTDAALKTLYRVREGKRPINQKFIDGAVKALPNYSLDDLFYLVPESPTDTNNELALQGRR